jgi:phage baseplate assembly protein W
LWIVDDRFIEQQHFAEFKFNFDNATDLQMYRWLMKGMSRENGKYLNDLEHLKQSIGDILTTPIGSRVMRREYGSNLFYLVDRPVNRDFLQQIYAAVAEALERWEPRLNLKKVTVDEVKDGRITLSLSGIYLITQVRVDIKGLVM